MLRGAKRLQHNLSLLQWKEAALVGEGPVEQPV